MKKQLRPRARQSSAPLDILQRPWTPFVRCEPDPRGSDITIYRNSRYQVHVRRLRARDGSPDLIHLSIKRQDQRPYVPYRERMRELWGPEYEAVELLPARSREVDLANQLHLWLVYVRYHQQIAMISTGTQHYLRIDPTKLAMKVAKAGYLEQNMATIEVLLDQDAVLSGAASRGEIWKYYDLGHGFCLNTFWAECKHRMACARCPFYQPKASAAEHLVEGKANLVRMLEFVSLTEDERLLVSEGIELHQALLEKLADTPTPAGPTPRELEGVNPQTREIIPLKTVQQAKRTK